ncbi:hypothetical protein [Marivita cryptomonadis]
MYAFCSAKRSNMHARACWAEAGCYKVQERTITKTYNVYHDGG